MIFRFRKEPLDLKFTQLLEKRQQSYNTAFWQDNGPLSPYSIFPPSILNKILLLLNLAPWKKGILILVKKKAAMINLPRNYNIRPKDKHGTVCLTFLKDWFLLPSRHNGFTIFLQRTEIYIFKTKCWKMNLSWIASFWTSWWMVHTH